MKIALIEKEETVDLTGFDKIISFCRDGHTNVDNYVKAEELYKISEEVYPALYSWLKEHNKNKSFVYRDADILQSYGKRIFRFLFNLYQKAYVVKKIVEKESPTELWISNDGIEVDTKYPYLALFISGFIPSGISLKYFDYERKQKAGLIKSKGSGLILLNLLLNIVRHASVFLNQKKDDNILINSDLNKIPELLKSLANKNNIFIREDLPKRLIFSLSRKRVCVRLFSDFKVSKRLKSGIRQTARSFINKLSDPLGIIAVRNSDLTPYLKKYIAATWQNELTQVLERVSQMHLLFSRFKINSLLVDEDRGYLQNLLVQIAKIYNCRSYVNCHGEPFEKNSSLPLTADFIFVWGARQKELLAKWGAEESRIIVAGCSKYDRYLQVSASSIRKKVCKDLKLVFSRPIALIAPFPLKKRRNIMENTIWRETEQTIITAGKFKDVQMIVKLHPGDDNEPHVRNLVRSLNSKNINVLTNYDPLLLVKGVDFLIVYISTLAMDGLAYKKPVILTNRGYLERYKRLEVFYDGTTESGLTDSIGNIINGSCKSHITNWQSAVNYCLDGMSGTTSKKIADILSKGGCSAQ